MGARDALMGERTVASESSPAGDWRGGGPEPMDCDFRLLVESEGKPVLFRTEIESKKATDPKDSVLCIFDANSHWIWW